MEQIDDVKLARRAYDILDTLLVNLERGKFKVT